VVRGGRGTLQLADATRDEDGGVFRETLWSLAKDGKTNEKGVPNLLQVAVIAREHAGEYRLVKPPWPVQRAIFALLAPVGKMFGYRSRYPERGG
jgi:hypothetical protein